MLYNWRAVSDLGELESEAENFGGSDEIRNEINDAPLAQLDRATASGAVGQKFESSVARRDPSGFFGAAVGNRPVADDSTGSAPGSLGNTALGIVRIALVFIT